MKIELNTIRKKIRYLTHPADLTEQFGEGDKKKWRLMAALCAIPFLFWLPLAKKNRSPFVLFHASNGLALLLGCGIALLVTLITGFLPIGWLISLPIWGFLAVESVFSSIEALSGSARELYLLFPLRPKCAAWLKKYSKRLSETKK